MAILSTEKENQMMTWYRQQMAIAAGKPPKLPDPPKLDAKNEPLKGEIERFQKESAAHQIEVDKYMSNPMLAVRNDAIAAVKRAGYPTNPDGSLIMTKASELELERQLADRYNKFKGGLTEGSKDKSHLSKAIGELGRFNIFGAIKELFLSIPIIGDFMATGGKMIMSLFSGKPLGPMTAFDEIRKERALAGGFEALGITNPDQVKALSRVAIDGAETAKEPVVVPGGGTTPPGGVTTAPKPPEPGVVIAGGAEVWKPLLVDPKNAVLKQALEELKKNKFIVITEGGKTAVYIGKEVVVPGEPALDFLDEPTVSTLPVDKKQFTVEKVMMLDSTGWVDKGKPAGVPATISYNGVDQVDEGAVTELKKLTASLGAAPTKPDLAMRVTPDTEVSSTEDLLALFERAAALAGDRFPPADPTDKKVAVANMFKEGGNSALPKLNKGGILEV